MDVDEHWNDIYQCESPLQDHSVQDDAVLVEYALHSLFENGNHGTGSKRPYRSEDSNSGYECIHR
jgi:hypothetical protein